MEGRLSQRSEHTVYLCAYLTSNHLPQGEAFLDHLWTLLPAAKRFAAEFYQTDGMCYPGVMALDGSPLGGWPMYSLSPTNSIWLCRLFYEHYRITGDPEFLRERVWPLYLECEHCIRGLLCETADGTLALPLSSSPEIYDDSPRAWLTPNSSYDLALLRDLYERLIELSALLGEPQTVWRSQLNRLPQLPADETARSCTRRTHLSVKATAIFRMRWRSIRSGRSAGKRRRKRRA